MAKNQQTGTLDAKEQLNRINFARVRILMDF